MDDAQAQTRGGQSARNDLMVSVRLCLTVLLMMASTTRMTARQPAIDPVLLIHLHPPSIDRLRVRSDRVVAFSVTDVRLRREKINAHAIETYASSIRQKSLPPSFTQLRSKAFDNSERKIVFELSTTITTENVDGTTEKSVRVDKTYTKENNNSKGVTRNISIDAVHFPKVQSDKKIVQVSILASPSNVFRSIRSQIQVSDNGMLNVTHWLRDENHETRLTATQLIPSKRDSDSTKKHATTYWAIIYSNDNNVAQPIYWTPYCQNNTCMTAKRRAKTATNDTKTKTTRTTIMADAWET